MDVFTLGMWAMRNRADISALIEKAGPVIDLIKIEGILPIAQRLMASLPSESVKLSMLDVQRALNKAGFAVAVDGRSGPATTAAIENFQRSHRLVVDGWVGPATIVVLEAFL